MRSFLCLATLSIAGSLSVLSPQITAQQPESRQVANQTEVGSMSKKDSAAIRELLARRISIRLNGVGLDRAIRMTAAAANVRVVFKTEYADRYAQQIRVQLTNVSLDSAFRRVLAGTNLVLAPSTATTFVVRELPGNARSGVASPSSTRDSTPGEILGKVLDSATRKGVSGVVVTVVGTKRSATTQADGAFRIADIPAGRYVLSAKMLGYQPKRMNVDVQSGQASEAIFALPQSSTTLTEVVTTATGLQRSFEVGSDITRINVDEVRKYNDITSVADLLANRVPGMYLQSGGGDAGAGARIRIRGVHSISLNNDPILIIDGVRVQSIGQTGTSLSSRLNDIDPASIETIEVFKGPSAATLYGPDAANGVIVITKKRGLIGETRWTFDANTRLSSIPRPFAGKRTVWGKNPESNQAVPCDAASVLDGFCSGFDSVSSYSLLNDPRHTTIGRGHNRDVGVSMRTGTSTMQTALSFRMTDVLGATKLSEAGVERLMDLKGAVPSWARRPNAEQQVNGDANVTLQSTPLFDVAFQASMTHLNLRNNGNGVLNGQQQDSVAFLPEEGFLRRQEELTDQYRAAMTLTARPAARINWSGTFGAEHGKNLRDIWQRPEDCLQADCSNALGNRTKFNQTSVSYTANSWAAVITPLSSLFTLRSSLGLNYSRDNFESFSLSGFNMPIGISDPSAAPITSGKTVQTQNAKAGGYVEERLSIGTRLFVNGAIRRDVGSGLGSSIKTPVFPKIDVSWIAFDKLVSVPGIGALHTVRLRAAHGQSGHQSAINDLKATLTRGQAWFDGTNHTVYRYNSLGNSLLKPERTNEMEFGFDMDLSGLLNTISVTYFNHVTKDAIIGRDVSNESGFPNLARSENLGKLRNSGFDASASLQLLDNDLVTWNFDASFAHTQNRVLALGNFSQVPPTGGSIVSQRVVEGYPVFGFWAKPIYSVDDRNKDGVLESNEFVIGDSMVYAGWGQPKYTLSYHTSVGLWRGNVRISSMIAQNGGFTKNATLGFTGSSVGDLRGQLQDRTMTRGLQSVSSIVWNSADVTVQLPVQFLRRIGSRSGTASLTGSNLYQWTNYQGSDPNVGPIGDDRNNVDSGITPNTRNWALRFSLSY